LCSWSLRLSLTLEHGVVLLLNGGWLVGVMRREYPLQIHGFLMTDLIPLSVVDGVFAFGFFVVEWIVGGQGCWDRVLVVNFVFGGGSSVWV